MSESKAETKGSHMENAVKLVGEMIVPGASLLIDGKILQGGAHAVVGSIARAALGPLHLPRGPSEARNERRTRWASVRAAERR